MYQGRKARDLGGQGGEVAGGDLQVFGADDAVDEPDREVQAVGVLQHPGELLGREGSARRADARSGSIHARTSSTLRSARVSSVMWGQR